MPISLVPIERLREKREETEDKVEGSQSNQQENGESYSQQKRQKDRECDPNCTVEESPEEETPHEAETKASTSSFPKPIILLKNNNIEKLRILSKRRKTAKAKETKTKINTITNYFGASSTAADNDSKKNH